MGKFGPDEPSLGHDFAEDGVTCPLIPDEVFDLDSLLAADGAQVVRTDDGDRTWDEAAWLMENLDPLATHGECFERHSNIGRGHFCRTTSLCAEACGGRADDGEGPRASWIE